MEKVALTRSSLLYLQDIFPTSRHNLAVFSGRSVEEGWLSSCTNTDEMSTKIHLSTVRKVHLLLPPACQRGLQSWGWFRTGKLQSENISKVDTVQVAPRLQNWNAWLKKGFSRYALAILLLTVRILHRHLCGWKKSHDGSCNWLLVNLPSAEMRIFQHLGHQRSSDPKFLLIHPWKSIKAFEFLKLWVYKFVNTTVVINVARSVKPLVIVTVDEKKRVWESVATLGYYVILRQYFIFL